MDDSNWLKWPQTKIDKQILRRQTMEGNKWGHHLIRAVAQLSAEGHALEVQEEATGTSMHQPDFRVADMTAQILAP